jgi:Cu(I)/Ag(I) efflux system membrane protein CusA/SilA
MLSGIIDACAHNRFLVFTAVLMLTLAGILHTGWSGEPPDVIEDQVTYPIVTSLLAAPI